MVQAMFSVQNWRYQLLLISTYRQLVPPILVDVHEQRWTATITEGPIYKGFC